VWLCHQGQHEREHDYDLTQNELQNHLEQLKVRIKWIRSLPVFYPLLQNTHNHLRALLLLHTHTGSHTFLFQPSNTGHTYPHHYHQSTSLSRGFVSATGAGLVGVALALGALVC
jgi:hypothetical protein